MATELSILQRAARKGCVLIEKHSRLCWTEEQVAGAAGEGRFAEEDRLAAPGDARRPVCSGVGRFGPAFPVPPRSYELVGQTAHFWVFARSHSGS